MRVRATKLCFAGGARRRPGDVFNFTPEEGKTLPAFLEEVDAPATQPDILPAVMAGQAPRSGEAPVQEPEPVNQSFVDPTVQDLQEKADAAMDPDVSDFLK